MKSKALCFLMAAAVAVTFVIVETVPARIGHALVPAALQSVNRLAKSGRLSERDGMVAVLRSSKSARLTSAARGPVLFPVVAFIPTAKVPDTSNRLAAQRVARDGKAGRLMQVADHKSNAPVERANRVAKASRLTKSYTDQFVARGLKTDSLKVIFAALTPTKKRAKAAPTTMPEPMVIDTGVPAQGGPLVFVPVSVSLSQSSNVLADPLQHGARAETL